MKKILVLAVALSIGSVMAGFCDDAIEFTGKTTPPSESIANSASDDMDKVDEAAVDSYDSYKNDMNKKDYSKMDNAAKKDIKKSTPNIQRKPVMQHKSPAGKTNINKY